MFKYTRILIASVNADAVDDFIKAISSPYPIVYGRTDNSNSRLPLSIYFRKIIDHEEVVFDVFGFAGDVKQVDFVFEISVEGIPVVVLLVPYQLANAIENTQAYLDLLRAWQIKTFIIADLKPSDNVAMLREQLKLSDNESLLTCSISDPQSVHEVLSRLLRASTAFNQIPYLMAHFG